MLRRAAWPVLVSVLLVSAALACSIDISTAHLENARLYKTAARDDSTRSFAPDDTVFCIVDLKDVEDTLPVRAVWSQNREPGETGGEDSQNANPVSTPLGEKNLDQGSGQLIIEIPPPENGWPKGSYTVELYLDGDKKETLPFSVK
jgi:hypothetical protein